MLNIFKSKKPHSLPILVFIVLLGVISSTSSKPQADEINKNIGLKITILLYSGRPDPIYFIEDKKLIDNIKDMINSSDVNHRLVDGTVIPSRLGYSGIIIENKTIAELPINIAIYKENIELISDHVEYLKDDGSLENFLLNQALLNEAIDQEIFNFIILDK